MNKLSITLFALLSLSPMGAHASPEPAVANSVTAQQRNLAIILDLTGSEGVFIESKAMQVDLSYQLASNNACILTTAHTAQKLMDTTICPNDKPATREFDFDLQERSRNIDAFEIYSDGFFVLLLPKHIANEYKPFMNIVAADLKPLPKPKSGGQASKWALFPNLTRWIHRPFNISWKSVNFMALLNMLFTKHGDVEWNIYMTGHGLPDGETCGVTETTFKQLLKFLATGLNTRLFIYDSCYAGGKMSEYMFEDQAQYPYTIICRCLGDNTTKPIADDKNIFSVLSQIKKNDDPQKIGVCLLSQHAEAYPKIRLPMSTTFTMPMHLASTLVIDQNTPAEQLKNPQKFIILNTPYITNPLALNFGCALYTALKGDSLHYLAKIESDFWDRREGFFEKLRELNSQNALVQKIFLFKDVKLEEDSIENCMAFFNSPMPESSLRLPWSQTNTLTIFYTCNGDGWIATQKEETAKFEHAFEYKQLSKKQTQAHLDLFQQLQNRIQNGEQPRRLMDNKNLRRLAQFRSLLGLGYLAAASFVGMHAKHSMDGMLPDNLSGWIQQPVSITAGLAASIATAFGLALTDGIIAQKLRHYDLGKK